MTTPNDATGGTCKCGESIDAKGRHSALCIAPPCEQYVSTGSCAHTHCSPRNCICCDQGRCAWCHLAHPDEKCECSCPNDATGGRPKLRYQGEITKGFGYPDGGKTDYHIYHDTGRYHLFATCQDETDAAFIVLAVNNHAKLVEALEFLLAFAERAHNDSNAKRDARALLQSIEKGGAR